MATRERFSFTTLSVLALAVIWGGPDCDPVRAQEVLPTMRKLPRPATAWVDDDSLPASSPPITSPTAENVAAPKKNVVRQGMPPANFPAATKAQHGVVTVSEERPMVHDRRAASGISHVPETAPAPERPMVKDRRAATLHALADGFRSQREEASSVAEVSEPPIALPTVPPQALPVTYTAPSHNEPVSQPTPVLQIPAQTVIASRATSVAAVEANMPATLEVKHAVTPETSAQSQTRFVTAEEPRQRPESWPTRMITNPLRRAADTLSGRRNPLRSAD